MKSLELLSSILPDVLIDKFDVSSFEKADPYYSSDFYPYLGEFAYICTRIECDSAW